MINSELQPQDNQREDPFPYFMRQLNVSAQEAQKKMKDDSGHFDEIATEWLTSSVENITTQLGDMMKNKSDCALQVINSVMTNLLKVDNSQNKRIDESSELHNKILTQLFDTLRFYLKSKAEFEDCYAKAQKEVIHTDLELQNLQKMVNEFKNKWKGGNFGGFADAVPFMDSLNMISSEEFLDVVPKSQNYEAQQQKDAFVLCQNSLWEKMQSLEKQMKSTNFAEQVKLIEARSKFNYEETRKILIHKYSTSNNVVDKFVSTDSPIKSITVFYSPDCHGCAGLIVNLENGTSSGMLGKEGANSNRTKKDIEFNDIKTVTSVGSRHPDSCWHGIRFNEGNNEGQGNMVVQAHDSGSWNLHNLEKDEIFIGVEIIWSNSKEFPHNVSMIVGKPKGSK